MAETTKTTNQHLVLERLLGEEHGTMVAVQYQDNWTETTEQTFVAFGYLKKPMSRYDQEFIIENGRGQPCNDRWTPFPSQFSSHHYRQIRLHPRQIIDYCVLQKKDDPADVSEHAQ